MISSTPLPFQDQRALLRAAGVLGILGSLGCGCLGGFYAVFLPFVLPRLDTEEPALAALREQMSAGMSDMMLASGIWMILASAGLVWLFVGSIRIKKWARDLLHALGWLLAALVAVTVVFQCILLPRMLADPTFLTGGVTSPLPPRTLATIVVVSQVVTVGFYLAPALALILVYGLKHVRLTVKHFDPAPSWTEGRGPWVLAWWLILVTAASTALSMAPSSSDFLVQAGWGPLPVVQGTLAAIGVTAALLAWLVGIGKGAAWAGSLAWTAACGGLSLWRGSELDFVSAYREMGLPEAQVKMMETLYSDNTALLLSGAFAWVTILALLWWRRSDFTPVTR